MALATLSIDLEARLAGLQQGMDKAARLAEKESARMAKAFNLASAALAGIGAGIGLGGLTAFFASVVNGLDKLNDLADATGASIENLSALEGVALRTGTSLDTVGSALVKFNNVLKDAEPGSKAAAALQALGLNAEELKRIDPAEALRRTAVALAGFADDGNKARLVQELFGKSVKEAAPFLKDLAEQGALVGKVTREQAEEAEKFNKQLFALQTAAVDASRAIAGPLVSSINTLIDKLKEGQKEGRLAAATAEEFGRRILKLAPPQIQGLALGFQALTRGPAGNEPGAPQPPGFRPSQNYGDAFRPSLPGDLGGPPARGGRAGRSARPEIPFAITDSTELTRNLFLASEKDYEAIDKQLKRTEERAREAAETLRKSLVDEGRAVFEATRTPLEKLNIELARQQELLDQLGPSYRDTYERAVFAAQEAADAAAKLPEALAKADTFAKDLGLSFSSAAEDAIINFTSLRDVLKGLEQDLLRIATRKLITEPLGNAVTGLFKGAGGSGGGDLLGSLISKAGSLFSGFFAEGGFIPPGRWGIAGERGPEPVFGGRSGASVTPAGGQTIVVNVQAVPGMSRQTAQQQGEMIGRGIRTATTRNG
jgi:hypothetical protein